MAATSYVLNLEILATPGQFAENLEGLTAQLNRFPANGLDHGTRRFWVFLRDQTLGERLGKLLLQELQRTPYLPGWTHQEGCEKARPLLQTLAKKLPISSLSHFPLDKSYDLPRRADFVNCGARPTKRVLDRSRLFPLAALGLRSELPKFQKALTVSATPWHVRTVLTGGPICIRVPRGLLSAEERPRDSQYGIYIGGLGSQKFGTGIHSSTSPTRTPETIASPGESRYVPARGVRYVE